MKQIKSTADVKSLGTILFVGAHPDDETFLAAGIMMAAIQNGQTVACVTATKGEAGVKDESRWPQELLGEIRAREMEAALKIMGCNDHNWLGYRDGTCHEVTDEEGAARIQEFIAQTQPQTILTFDPTGLTGHLDHQAVSRWSVLAAKEMHVKVYYSVQEEELYMNYMNEVDKRFNFFFRTKKPPIKKAVQCDIAFQLPQALMDQKIEALRAMPSQTEDVFEAMPEAFCSALQMECFVTSNNEAN